MKDSFEKPSYDGTEFKGSKMKDGITGRTGGDVISGHDHGFYGHTNVHQMKSSHKVPMYGGGIKESSSDHKR